MQILWLTTLQRKQGGPQFLVFYYSLASLGLILEIVLSRWLWKTFNGAIFAPYLYLVFKL